MMNVRIPLEFVMQENHEEILKYLAHTQLEDKLVSQRGPGPVLKTFYGSNEAH
jgi:hypothetical protein